MQTTSEEEKVLSIVYRLTHLAELYDQFASYSAMRNEPLKPLKEFADRLEREGAPYGDGMVLKKTTKSNSVVPIFELFELYQNYPDRPEITIEEFTHFHKLVDRFRRDKGYHGTFLKE